MQPNVVYVIYGITDLMDLSLEYVFIEMDFSKSYRDSIKEKLKWTTFPIVVKLSGLTRAETLIGGYSELIKELTGECTTSDNST